MIERLFIVVILATSLFPGITWTAKEKPLVPRLKYTSTGRYLDNPESVTFFLAKHNSEGFPNEIFYRSLEDDSSQSDFTSVDLRSLSSPEAQRSLEEASLDYFSDVLDGPEAHAAVAYSGRDQRALCSYSWISWVPWLDCPSEQRGVKAEKITTSQLHAQCVVPEVINYHTRNI